MVGQPVQPCRFIVADAVDTEIEQFTGDAAECNHGKLALVPDSFLGAWGGRFVGRST